MVFKASITHPPEAPTFNLNYIGEVRAAQSADLYVMMFYCYKTQNACHDFQFENYQKGHNDVDCTNYM